MANAFDQPDDRSNPFDVNDHLRGESNPFDVNDHLRDEPQPNKSFFSMSEEDRKATLLVPNISRIMKRFSTFGEAFMAGLQPESLGISSPSVQFLKDNKILPKDSSDFNNPLFPFAAFNEGVLLPLATGIDAIARTAFSALPRGTQALMKAGGFPNDIVSIPEAFMGSPHPLGIPPVRLEPPKPFVKQVDIKPIEGSPNPGVLRTEAAKTSDPLIDQILDHPTMKAVIENPVVDDSHTIPNSLGGSTPMENPTLYRDRDFPKTMTVDGEPQLPPVEPGFMRFYHGGDNPTSGGGRWVAEDLTYAKDYRPGESVHYVDIPQTWLDQKFRDTEMYSMTHPDRAFYPRRSYPNFEAPEQFAKQMKPVEFNSVTFDTAEPSAIHENVEEFVIDALTKTGMDQATALKVAFWNFGEVAEDAWYRSHGMDPEKVEAKYTEHLNRIAARGVDTKVFESSTLTAHNADISSFKSSFPDAKELGVPNTFEIPMKDGVGALEVAHSFGAVTVRNTYVESGFEGKGYGVQAYKELADWALARGLKVQSSSSVKAGAARVYAALERRGYNVQENPNASMSAEGNVRTSDAKPAFVITKGSGVPPDLFKETYPDGDPAKAAPGPIDKPTPEESARGRQLLEQYLAGEGNPSGIVAFHGSPSEFGKFNTKTVDVSSDRALAERYQQGRGADRGKGFLYQVSVKASPDDFLNLDKPLSAQSDKAKIALERAGITIDQRSGADVWDALREAGSADKAAKTLQDAGLAGTSREHGVYSVFDPNAVQITHVNGQPILDAARDLGVIGPPKVPLTEGKPAEAVAARAARRDGDGSGKPPGGGGPGGPAEPPQPTGNPWRDRFEHFVTKLDTGEDVRQLIREAADEKDEFPAARQGNIKLADVEDIAEAAGVEPSEIDARGLGRLLKNDAEVDIAMRLMMQAAENAKEAARNVKADRSPENLIKLQEAVMRRDLAVEQIVGLRAEWGRTGNVFQKFMRDVKDQETLSEFLKDKGRTSEDLVDIANAIDALDTSGAARVLNELRGKRPGPVYWATVQGWISGYLTHTKYVAANAFYAGMERGVVTPMAALIGKAKELGGSEADRVFFGETVAGVWGSIAATPTSFMAAARSIRSGLRVPLESETALRDAMIARGEKAPASLERAVNPVTGQMRPEAGIWARILPEPFVSGLAKLEAPFSIPGRFAQGIHTFFKIMGEQASLQTEAYHQAAAEGLSPTDARFWSRRAEIAAAPTEEMRQKAVDEAYKGTFMGELGPRGRAFQRFVKDTPGLKWLFPFTHIPLKLMGATVEYTPAAPLSLLLKDSELAAAIKGEKGGRAQDMAIARMVVGSSIMGWFANAYLNGQATGDMPRDQESRDHWKLQGKQPNSILIGDYWVSFNKFGPAGDLASLGANIGAAIQYLKSDDDDAMTKATYHAAEAAARLIVDEVGFQSLANLFEAYHDPDKQGVRWVASTAGSFIPFSSAVSQTASGGVPGPGWGGDPYMREAKTIIDGFKYRVPGLRETLLPKRDWTGAPIENPQYGNIIRQKMVNTDPVDMEMDRLGLHAAPPPDRVGGVKLPPKLYDQYQVMAGTLTRDALERAVAQPNWYKGSEFVRSETMRALISASRARAGAAIQLMYPQIWQQGVQQRVDHINNVKTPKLKDIQ